MTRTDALRAIKRLRKSELLTLVDALLQAGSPALIEAIGQAAQELEPRK